MYFPLLKPRGQRKRSAAQPKTVDSEIPYLTCLLSHKRLKKSIFPGKEFAL